MTDSYDSLPSGYNPAESLNGHAPRSDLIQLLRSSPKFDLVVVGGGIHGATAAQCAALSGLRVLLLERSDFASETSSRSSKMLHGGFRYLQHLDFRQVLEGVKARERYFKIAPHLAKPARFLLPVQKSAWWHKYLLFLGFSIYDLFVREAARRFFWVSPEECEARKVPVQNSGLLGAFDFCDGLTSDSALTLATVQAAVDEGAIALNYLEVQHITPHGQMAAITWCDKLTGEQGRLYAGAVCNTAGPFAPTVSGACPRVVKRLARYSRGVHLVFRVPWTGTSLLLPMEGFGRYYFVWPHPAGTLVGTTERECAEPEFSPHPTKEEVGEILRRLSNDLPTARLSKENLCHAFCGIRTMVAARDSGTAGLSRRHRWFQNGSVFTLLGGKLTTAMWTAREGVQKILKLAGLKTRAADLSTRPLPGSNLVPTIDEFMASGRAKGVAEEILAGAVSRLGGLVRHLIEQDPDFRLVGRFLESEVRFAFEKRHAITLEDLMCRRLGLEYESGHGLDQLTEFSRIIADYIPAERLAQEIASYTNRMSQIDQLLSEV